MLSGRNPTERLLARIAVTSVVALAAGCSSDPVGQLGGPAQPNIVLILADDLGIGDLGAYGQHLIRTPHLDRMAAEGMRFTQFYAGSTVCAPSRATLMTGRHTGMTFVRGNGEFPLDPAETTLAQLLRDRGYVTAMFGKWGLGLEGTPGDPRRAGWDRFVGHLHHVDAHFQQPDSLWQLEDGVLEPFALPEDTYANELFTEEAVAFLDRRPAHRPFFLYLAFSIPHAELIVPDEYIAPYLDEDGTSVFAPELAWPAGRHYAAQSRPRAAYAALVSSIDRYVGRVLERLRQHGLDRHTLVLFSSDNGTHIEGGRGLRDVALFASSGGHRGIKRDLYEGGIRVPLIAWWPGAVQPSSVSDHVGAFWDVLPTVAELADARPPAATDGISFAPTLLGRGEQRQHEFLYWEFHELGGKQAVRKGEWKGVRGNARQKPDGRIELYNLSIDPGERLNVAARHPDLVREIESLMNSRRRSPIAQWNFASDR